jgi:hypothetical protein
MSDARRETKQHGVRGVAGVTGTAVAVLTGSSPSMTPHAYCPRAEQAYAESGQRGAGNAPGWLVTCEEARRCGDDVEKLAERIASNHGAFVMPKVAARPSARGTAYRRRDGFTPLAHRVQARLFYRLRSTSQLPLTPFPMA